MLAYRRAPFIAVLIMEGVQIIDYSRTIPSLNIIAVLDDGSLAYSWKRRRAIAPL